MLERQMGEMLRGTQAMAGQLVQILEGSPHASMWSPVLESRMDALDSNLTSMVAALDELEQVARHLHLEVAPDLAGIMAAGGDAQQVHSSALSQSAMLCGALGCSRSLFVYRAGGDAQEVRSLALAESGQLLQALGNQFAVSPYLAAAGCSAVTNLSAIMTSSYFQKRFAGALIVSPFL